MTLQALLPGKPAERDPALGTPDELFHQHYKNLMRWVTNKYYWHPEFHEIYSKAQLKLYKAAWLWPGTGPFEAWAKASIKYEIRHVLFTRAEMNRKYEGTHYFDDQSESWTWRNTIDTTYQNNNTATAIENITYGELIEQIEAILATEKYAHMYRKYVGMYGPAMSYVQLAAELGCTRQWVTHCVQRIHTRVQNTLKGTYHEQD